MRNKPNNIHKYEFGSDEFRDYFRNQYIKEDSGLIFLKFKNGRYYLITIYSLAIIFFLFSAMSISTWNNSFYFIIPIFLVFANLFEYVLHRFPMHKKIKGFEFLFEHVTVHHNFYSKSYPYHTDHRDYFGVFLPLQYFIFINLEILGISFLIRLISNQDYAFLFMAVAYFYYFMYEVFHFSYHANENSILKKIPGIKRLSKFHLLHHDEKLMNKYNFNISIPLFDYLFGSNYKQGRDILK